MYKIPYPELVSWLDRFPIGKQQVTILKSVIGLNTVKGSLSNMKDVDGRDINLIAFNDDQLLKVEIKSTEQNLTDITTEIEIYSLKELVSKKISFKDPYFSEPFQNTTFKGLECTLEFRDGKSFKISSSDYLESFDEFLSTIALLAAK